MEEYNNASFTHKGTTIDASKEAKKRSYDKNNSRNRDIYSLEKARGMLNDLDSEEIVAFIENNQRADISEEDVWIKLLDAKNLDDSED